MKLIQIMEGKAKLTIPKESYKDPFHLPVFYNPAMKFNRTVSSLALSCILRELEGAILLDGLCSIGARGIRYAKENRLKRVYFVDANPDAIRILKRNVRLNKIKNAKIEENDLNKFLLNSKGYFDFIEIDPFGSPVFFLQNAIRRLKKKAVLSITATDLANLAGANAKPCIKHYGSRPLRSEYQHEIALRILIGKIARELMLFDYYSKPLLSFYKGHAVKAIILCERSAVKADANIVDLGYVMHCYKCLYREVNKRQIEKCKECGNDLEYSGPLWIGKLEENDFLERLVMMNEKMRYEEQEEIHELIKALLAENELPPTFYDLHKLASKYKLKIRKTREVLERIRNKGYKAEGVHYSSVGIKTTATLKQLIRMLRAN